jgi:hypothetical protein
VHTLTHLLYYIRKLSRTPKKAAIVNIKKTTTVKKTAKKAVAKKIYPSAKKNFPNQKRITVNELFAVLEASIRKLSAENAKTEASIREFSEQTKRTIDQLSIENRKTSAEVRKVTKTLDESFGGISRRLGRLTELVVVPKIRFNMNELGHNFESSKVDMLIRGVVGGRKEDIAEVDMLLYGLTEAMAVEIKTRLKDHHVKDHIDRLQDLRDNEDDAGIKDKKLFGAMVGIVVDDLAREVAKRNGLYVVEIREEEGKLIIDKPETCRTW